MGSLADKAFDSAPSFLEDEKEHRRKLAAVLGYAMQGKLNCTADATLKKDAVSTTVSDVRAGPASVVLPMPTSANGGVALGTWSVNTRSAGSFVLSHVSTSTSDCTLTYAIFG